MLDNMQTICTGSTGVSSFVAEMRCSYFSVPSQKPCCSSPKRSIAQRTALNAQSVRLSFPSPHHASEVEAFHEARRHLFVEVAVGARRPDGVDVDVMQVQDFQVGGVSWVRSGRPGRLPVTVFILVGLLLGASCGSGEKQV